MTTIDFAAHNAEVAECWEAFRNGTPYRVPIIVGTNTRYFMLDPQANREGISFRDYSEDPAAMYRAQLAFAHWTRHHVLQDAEMGMPSRWWVQPDFQNFYEAAWLGCPIEYIDGQVPDTIPAYADAPERVMEQGLPDPFGGFFARGLEFVEEMQELARDAYCDRPVDVGFPGCGTDGPFTCACNLFTAEVVCTMIVEEPERLATLLDFITTANIARMRAWRERAGIPSRQEGIWLADDSVALISTSMYRDLVLPLHRRMYDALASDKGRGMHLCGNSTRHFKTMAEELGIEAFDTGFPVDFAWLRQELGPEITIQGGPHVELMRSGSPDAVFEEAKRILQTGVLSGPFILREGNNLAPGTPLENVEALYRAGRAFGVLDHRGAITA